MKIFLGLGISVTGAPTAASRSGTLVETVGLTNLTLNDPLADVFDALGTTSDPFYFDLFTSPSPHNIPDDMYIWTTAASDSDFPDLGTTASLMTIPVSITTGPADIFPDIFSSIEPIFPESTVGPTLNIGTTQTLVFPPNEPIQTTVDPNGGIDDWFFRTTRNQVDLDSATMAPVTTMTAKIVSPSTKATTTTTTTTLGNPVVDSIKSTVASTAFVDTTSTRSTTASITNYINTTTSATETTTSILTSSSSTRLISSSSTSMSSSTTRETSTLVIIPVNSTVEPISSSTQSSTVVTTTLSTTTPHATVTTSIGKVITVKSLY